MLPLLSLLLFVIPGAAQDALLYSRPAIADGEIWRLITGHFVHCDVAHLAWNLVPIYFIAGLLEQRIGSEILWVILVSCLGVSGWIWFVETDMLLYCGLSGMINGVLAVLLVTLWRETKHPLLPIMGGVALLKIMYETVSHHSLFTSLSWESVPITHGAGLAAGIVYLMVMTVCRKGNCKAAC